MEEEVEIYLSSDGFPDQFGGPKGKKYMSLKFKKLLLQLSNEATAQQNEKLQKEFEDWKGNYNQIDDVTVIGVRV